MVLDTHAWVWWTESPRKLSRSARDTIAGAERIGVATISCFEFVVLAERGRITVDRDSAEWARQALAQDRVEELSLTADIAVAAALLERKGFHGDPGDRIIYATARAHDAPLVTKDARLLRFDPQRTLW
ncbi:MAG: type II toxin-antitoxin system VapC family toxin [Gaiellaceae bacterium]